MRHCRLPGPLKLHSAGTIKDGYYLLLINSLQAATWQGDVILFSTTSLEVALPSY